MKLSIQRRTCYDSNSLAYLISWYKIAEQLSNFINQKTEKKKLFINSKSVRSSTTMSKIIAKHEDHDVIPLKKIFSDNTYHRFIDKHGIFIVKDKSMRYNFWHTDEIAMYDYIESSRQAVRETRRRKRENNKKKKAFS